VFTQLLTNQNNDNTTGNNRDEEENNEHPKTEKSKESSLINAEIIKGIQAQIASLTLRDELKKVEMTRPYPLEWDSILYPPKFKPPTLHTNDGKSSPNQYIYYFWSQTGNVIDNDAIMARLFIGTLKGVAFDWFRIVPSDSINSSPENSVPLSILRRWHRGDHGQAPLDGPERRKIRARIHWEVL